MRNDGTAEILVGCLSIVGILALRALQVIVAVGIVVWALRFFNVIG